jgi:hypothetical protein
VGSHHDFWVWTTSVSWKRVVFFMVVTDARMAMMEIRLLLCAIVLKFESWTGVPDEPGKWAEEMKPCDSLVLTPRKDKCVLKFNERN